MDILNLNRLVFGEILGTPAISRISGFTFTPHKNCKNLAFIALNATQNDIKTAVLNGAYAVIFDKNLDLTGDDEIAYIKVNDINLAISRLITYFIALKSIKFVKISELQKDLFKILSFPKKLTFAPDNEAELLLNVYEIENETIFLCNDEIILKNFGGKFEQILQNFEYELLFKGSIFFTSFIFDEIYYPNLSISRFFLPELCGIISFLNKHKIVFKIKDTKSLAHFEPIFVDKFLQIHPFGETYHAFLVEKDKDVFVKAAWFLRSEFSSNIVICAPWNEDFGELKIDFRFSNLSALQNIGEFHYALIYGDKDEILQNLTTFKQTVSSLKF